MSSAPVTPLAKGNADIIALERVELSDEDDDNFKYEEVAVESDEDGDSPEDEDLASALASLQKEKSLTQQPKAAHSRAPENTDFSTDQSEYKPTTQVRPAVIDDFIRNFLIKIGMGRTLDAFNTEWYELKLKGKLKEEDVSVVPDIYLRNQELDEQVKILRAQVSKMEEIATKAQSTWDKFRKERDHHKMHHKRVVQEKNKLIEDMKRLKKHFSSYEPTLQELKNKYEMVMKEKMLMRLERDKLAAKVTALEAHITSLEEGQYSSTPAGSGAAAVTRTRGDAKGSVRGAGASSSSAAAKETASSSSAAAKAKKRDPKPAAVPTNAGGEGGEKKTAGGMDKKDTKLPAEELENPHLKLNYDPVAIERFQLSKSFRGHVNAVSALAFHPKKPIIATVSDDQTWKLWSVPNCELIMSGEGHRGWIAGVSFHPHGKHLATASGDGTIKIWDFATASLSLSLLDHSQPVWEVDWHCEGDFVVSGSMDQTARFWDVNTGRCRQTLRGHVDSVNSVCFQPYSTNVCTGSGDKTLSVWDVRSGLCVQTFYGHLNAVNHVVFSRKGDLVASCDADGVVKLWDVRMVAERATLEHGQHPINKVCFDRSGSILAAASDDGLIKTFNTVKHQFIRELSGHEDAVQAVAFDPSGKFLASAGSDCTFRIWTS